MKAKAESPSLDQYGNLPQNIIENILCLVPIKDAVRTSILSRNWRYNWVTIPKLVFSEKDIFDRTTFEEERRDLSRRLLLAEEDITKLTLEWEELKRKLMLEKGELIRELMLVELELLRKATLEKELIRKVTLEWEELLGKFKSKMFNVILQVLLVHKGPIQEFSLSLSRVNFTRFHIETCVELDQIISQLARNNNTLKKFTLDLGFKSSYKLPLSMFSLHQLTDLSLSGCAFDFNQTFSGIGSLTSLYLESDNVSKRPLLQFLSNCPLLKSFILVSSINAIDEDITIIELCSCLPVIEYLSLKCWNIQFYAQDRVRKLPSALVNLKYFYLNTETLLDDHGLWFVCLVLRSSPNLETFKLEIASDDSDDELVTLEDCSDIWLEHLKELEFKNFSDQVGEMKFVKLMLAKSPVLKKMRIIHNDRFTEDEELEILRILSGSQHVSPVVEIIVARNPCLEN